VRRPALWRHFIHGRLVLTWPGVSTRRGRQMMGKMTLSYGARRSRAGIVAGWRHASANCDRPLPGRRRDGCRLGAVANKFVEMGMPPWRCSPAAKLTGERDVQGITDREGRRRLPCRVKEIDEAVLPRGTCGCASSVVAELQGRPGDHRQGPGVRKFPMCRDRFAVRRARTTRITRSATASYSNGWVSANALGRLARRRA
jgi:hypothetical protein